jgi:hypothetical protein
VKRCRTSISSSVRARAIIHVDCNRRVDSSRRGTACDDARRRMRLIDVSIMLKECRNYASGIGGRSISTNGNGSCRHTGDGSTSGRYAPKASASRVSVPAGTDRGIQEHARHRPCQCHHHYHHNNGTVVLARSDFWSNGHHHNFSRPEHWNIAKRGWVECSLSQDLSKRQRLQATTLTSRCKKHPRSKATDLFLSGRKGDLGSVGFRRRAASGACAPYVVHLAAHSWTIGIFSSIVLRRRVRWS